jgi:signal transduction histidine kinase
MIGVGLFRRFFTRFLIGIGIAFFAFLMLVHIFQVRIVDTEWREELRQEAQWLGRHTHLSAGPILAGAWKQMHSAVRVTFFDPEGQVIADSHPERVTIDLAQLEKGREPPGQLAVVEELNGGGLLAMSRPYVPAFPAGMYGELAIAISLILAPMILLLYPFVRSMTSTLHDLGVIAGEVSSGHFGKTIPISRAGGANRDELGELVLSFNDMSEKLAEAERLNSRLLHDVSHELRSPLGRIQVLAETVELRPDETYECVRGIEQEIALLDRLVGDLLQVARIESSRRSAEHEAFSLRHWAIETTARLERSARAHGIGWTARLPDDDAEVHGDRQHLALALGNLVDNAIHALKDRADAAIRVEVARDGDQWSITVADNGPGISEEHLEHVFRRFYRADEHRGRESGGVGLGLSLVRAIAEVHGGDASIESRVEGGTRVTMSLPVG